jgi:hypothetical protein
MKRSSSSKYEAEFQEALLNKCLDDMSSKDIIDWIELEKERIKTLPLQEVAFPCKIQNKEYKTTVTRGNGVSYKKAPPIFVRAYNNSKFLYKKFKVVKGELFYYIFIKPTKLNDIGKIIDVLAFTEEDNHISRDMVDWEEVIRRSFEGKIDKIFEALGWDIDYKLDKQLTLF